jgi:tRNA-specific 2-thiouridylase
VVVGGADDLLEGELAARDVSWLPGAPPSGPVEAAVQIRHRSAAVPATVTATEAGGAIVRFARPVRAVAPGQAAVFYAGDEVLGGGWICASVSAPM